jgi:hypothetical protein
VSEEPWQHAAPQAFGRLRPPLEVFVSGIQGGYGALDWVARDPRGGLAVVLAAEPSRFLDVLGRALAERLWLEPRVTDWARLAPERGLEPEHGLGLWVAGAGPEPGAEEAARAAGIGLLRMVPLGSDWHADPTLPQGPERTVSATRRPRSVFRSGPLPG